jgi:CubicO group peptidase (beta-lactamase class C family)
MSERRTLSDLHDELHARVAEAAGRLKIPGVAVGVYRDGAEDYVYHGVTSITNPLPVDEGTLFQIGSTTKTYTGTAIMMLVERGEVELSAPVRRYLPDFRLRDEDVAANVTVLHLLNHTAGWAGDFEAKTGYGDDALARYVERLVEAPQESGLGERVSYNNASLCVAGRIIEVVTGKTYEAAIREMIYEPLGLEEHAFFPWEIMTRRFAAGHALYGDELQVTHWYESRAGHPPGAEHAASARDQIAYARFHLGDGSGVLRRETLEQMQTLTTPEAETPQAQQFGITWMIREFAGTRIVAHGGSCRGHQSAFEMIPEHDFAVTVLTSARHGSGLNTEITDWIRSAYLGLVEEAPDPLPLTAEELAEYTGTYDSYSGSVIVTIEGDHLRANLEINPELGMSEEEAAASVPSFPFVILPGNQFLITDSMYKGLRGGIVREDDGHVTALDVGRVFTKRV